MSHSPSRIWIHTIWSTKDRLPLIHPTDKLLYKFLEGEFQEMGPPVKTINCMDGHIHVLLLLNPQRSLVEVIKQTMGGSSLPIYPQNLIREKFSWQTGSAPFTSGGTLVEKVSLYTDTPKERYAKKTFQSKYNEIIKDHGFEMEI